MTERRGMCNLKGTSRLAVRFCLLMGCVEKAPHYYSFGKRIHEGTVAGKRANGGV